MTTFVPSPLSSNATFAPRIEAMSQYRGLGTGVKWQIVAPLDNPSTLPRWQIWGFNDLGGVNWISNMYNLSTDWDCKAPCVAAGITPRLTTDIGNMQYTAGFYPRTLDTLHERSFNAVTGTMDPRWWNVNCPSFPVTYHWDVARSMAVTNCSNSGYNLLTAWYDNANIVYKESPNTMVFKQPLGVNPNSKAGKLRVYPNPAADELRVAGAVAGSTYRVSDVSGRTLISGTLPVSTTLDTRSLSSGMYLLSVSDEQKGTQTLKFTRQ